MRSKVRRPSAHAYYAKNKIVAAPRPVIKQRCLPGRLFDLSTRKNFPLFSVDVRANEIEIVTGEQLNVGAFLGLQTHDDELLLKVVERRSDLQRWNLNRYVLVVTPRPVEFAIVP